MSTAAVSNFNGVTKIGVGAYDVSYNNVEENNNLGDDLLDDLDSYLEDINDRLTISRMVSDSVIKGMVNAVSQEAAEIGAVKELELAQLKEALHHHRFCCGGFGASVSPRMLDEQILQTSHLNSCYAEQILQTSHLNSCYANGFAEPDNLRESLYFLNQAVKEQLERLEKYIVNPEGLNCHQFCSAPNIDSVFCSLKGMLKAMSKLVHAIASDNWKLDLQICEEMEAMVFHTIFQSVKDDYERCLWDVNTVRSVVDRFHEISSLRMELDTLQKCLVAPEHGHLSPQGLHEIDLFHRKVLSSHGLPSGSLWDGNGKCEESNISLPENLETSKLNHMTREELYQYFRTEITTMKRDHESTVQQMIEEYFTMKREFLKEKEHLKERGPFVVFRKDKDFEMLRNKISDAILKLDDILIGSEKLSEFCNHSWDMLDCFLSENQRLKDMLMDQKLELCHLTLQASDTSKKLSQQSLGEHRLHELIEHLKNCLEDARIETSISENVYMCTSSELALQMKSNFEDFTVKSVIMQDIIRVIYEEAIHDAEVAIRSDCGNISGFESTFMQQICGIVFQEVLKDMFKELSELKKKFLEKDESLILAESSAAKLEQELQREIEENKELNDQVTTLEILVKVKEKSLVEVTDTLEEKRQQLEAADLEIRNLRAKYEALTSDCNELVSLRDKVDNCQKQIDWYMIEVAKLNELRELSEIKSRKASEEQAKFILEKEETNLALLKAKDIKHRKQMELFVHAVQGLLRSFVDFELRAKESVSWYNDRMENSAFQVRSLILKVNTLRRTGVLYKKRLEKSCSDLQKAEAEVDILGDEVETLLSLLEKIYVALDHYSPILQHYPGIMDILKLVRRELSGEVVKAVRLAA